MDRELFNMLDNVYSEHTVMCSLCGDHLSQLNTDDHDFAERCIRDGWRATDNNVYCPSCASKRLKPKKV